MLMSRTTKVLTFSVPPSMADEVERIALAENRNKSELFREMLRVYRVYRKHWPEPEMSEAWTGREPGSGK
jgi:metal-responsive CopG/Arc/MetJ family transcriptional regulator